MRSTVRGRQPQGRKLPGWNDFQPPFPVVGTREQAGALVLTGRYTLLSKEGPREGIIPDAPSMMHLPGCLINEKQMKLEGPEEELF